MFQSADWNLGVRQVEIISGLPADATISLYRCGPMVDLCRGPHLPNTGLLKATAVNFFAAAYWKGDQKRESLQVPALPKATSHGVFDKGLPKGRIRLQQQADHSLRVCHRLLSLLCRPAS